MSEQSKISLNTELQTDECPVVEINNLTKSYGTKLALDDVSFSVKKGEVMGFLGPNGAGKSTTMNIITGYLAAGKGSVKIDGIDISENPIEARKKIGYLPEIPPLYTDMTVKEYLGFVYDLKQIKRKDKAAHLNRIMETVKIREVKGRLIKNLSKGYKQRVGLAQALIGDPEVLILDEPTVGLDPKQIMEIREVISKLGEKRTIILSTHILQEVSAVCDSYIIINQGRIASVGSIADLANNAQKNRNIIRVKCRHTEAEKILSSVDDIDEVVNQGSYEPGSCDVLTVAKVGVDVREDIFNAFSAVGCPILKFEADALSLEELFMQVISGNAAEENITFGKEAAEV